MDERSERAVGALIIIRKRECFAENKIIINWNLNNNLSRKSVLTANRLDFCGRTERVSQRQRLIELTFTCFGSDGLIKFVLWTAAAAAAGVGVDGTIGKNGSNGKGNK